MKKFFKILGVLILLVALIIGGFAAFISIRGIPKFEANVPEIPKIEVTPERVEKGKKIASMLCNSCHFDKSTGKFTGREMTEVPEFGKIISRNITQDPEIGIGKWTDSDLVYFIRTGINPHTGQYVPPYMPKLMHISDEDLNSIIAFLRSDDALVQPDKTEGPSCEPSFLTKFLCLVAFKPFPYPEKPIPGPDTTNKLAWGKYLTLYEFECFACHSADFKKMDVGVPENSLGFFGGGNVMRNDQGVLVTTRNLTPDEETGIGNWTEEQFVKAVKFGIVPNGPALRNPMIPYAQLTDEEAKAIYAYLRTVPKIKHAISRGI